MSAGHSHAIPNNPNELADRFDIRHSTVQLEDVPCEQASGAHVFAPASTAREETSSHSH